MKTFVTSICVLALLVLGVAGCGDRTSNGGVDTGSLDADISIDIAFDLPWNPWDNSSLDIPAGKTSVTQLQSAQASTQCSDGIVNVQDAVELANVVVVSPGFSASSKLDGYYVNDAGLAQTQPWSGMLITLDKTLGVTLQPGDLVAMTVDYLEYYCMSEAEVVTHQVVGTNAVPQPATMNPLDLGSQDPTTAEPWEGVLVMVKDVEVTEAVVPGSDGKDHGDFRVTGGLIVGNDFNCNYMSKSTDQRTVGDRFDAIIGVVTYSFGQYVLMPRWDADLIPEGGMVHDVIEGAEVTDITQEIDPSKTTVEQVQSTGDSLQCTADSIQNFQQGMDMIDVVVTGPKYPASGSLDAYFVAETGLAIAAPLKGITITVDKGAATDFAVGTVLSLKADHTEYYCLSELDVTSFTHVGDGAVPQPMLIDPADLGGQNAAIAEPLEGVLVKVENVAVIQAIELGNDGKDHGSFRVTGDLIVANTYHLPYMNKDTDQRTLGDKFGSITGLVTYSFGKYELLPRWEGDMVPGGTLPDVPPETVSEPTVEPVPDVSDVPDVSEGVLEVFDPGPGEDVKPETTTSKKSVYDIQSAAGSTGCTVEEAEKVMETNVEMQDVVVVSPLVFVSGTIRGYYVSDPLSQATEYTGILVTFPSDWTVDFAMGDMVSITGDYVEHFCLSEIMAATMVKTGTGAVPTAASVSASDFGEGGGFATEPWEGVYVNLADVLTVQDAAGGNKPAWWFKVKTDTVNNIFISNNFDIDNDNANTPVVDDVFTSITGFVKYSWETYLIAPHTIGDLVK